MLRFPKISSICKLVQNLQYNFALKPFHLPDLGQKIKEGVVRKLYISQGQQVTQFQKIADVSSDKQNAQISARDSGIVKKIYFHQDTTIQVGDLFLQIETGQQEISTSGQQQQKSAQGKKISNNNNKKSEESNDNDFILATPFIRGLIKQNKIDITKIKGSGVNGRIIESDLQPFLSKSKATQQPLKKPQKQPVVASKPDVSQQKIITPPKGGIQTVLMSGFQRGMQKSMTQSNTIPHLYFHEQLDLTETQKMRKTIKANNQKVTVMGILIKTFSLALKKYPKMNSIYEPHKNQFQYYTNSQHNISIAIDSPNGLVVPNIKSVNRLNLSQIQSQIERLRKLSQEARLTINQLGGGTVCLSNIGTIGGTHAGPLILPPQICIVAIGKMQVVPKYKGESLIPRNTINISFGCDHRVIDGATVARFSNEWKRIIQNPYLALAEMS